ncbi:MAG: hypothetical protein AB1552_06455 [Nitrospirota bacterium]
MKCVGAWYVGWKGIREVNQKQGRKANRALYQAKDEGRDRVVVVSVTKETS